MNRLLRLLAIVASLWLAIGETDAQQRYEANWGSPDKRPAPECYLDAKFGIFLHWGIYSALGWGALSERSTAGHVRRI